MLASFCTVLLCQLIGEVTAHVFHLPLPGPVLGILLLLVLLLMRDRFAIIARGPLADRQIEKTGNWLIDHLSLLFVPAAVGVVQRLDLLAAHGIAILLILILSVVVTSLATTLSFYLVGRLLKQRMAR